MTQPLRIAHVATVDISQERLLLNQLLSLMADGYDVTGISAPGPMSQRFDEQLVFQRVKAEYRRLLREKGLPLLVGCSTERDPLQCTG